MTNQDLINIGFVKVPNFNILDAVEYDLGNSRRLSAGCVGSANEMLYVCEVDKEDPKVTTDLVCVHNYDFQQELTLAKVKSLIELLSM